MASKHISEQTLPWAHFPQKQILKQKLECRCFTWEVIAGSTSGEEKVDGEKKGTNSGCVDEYLLLWETTVQYHWDLWDTVRTGLRALHPSPPWVKGYSWGYQLPDTSSLPSVPAEHGPMAREIPQG